MTGRRVSALFAAVVLLVLTCPQAGSALAVTPAPAATPTAVAETRPAGAPVHVRTLADGLRVVVIEDHAAPVAQVHMWYRFGALDELPGKTGLAHALEHMMFRGTHDISAPGSTT